MIVHNSRGIPLNHNRNRSCQIGYAAVRTRNTFAAEGITFKGTDLSFSAVLSVTSEVSFSAIALHTDTDQRVQRQSINQSNRLCTKECQILLSQLKNEEVN